MKQSPVCSRSVSENVKAAVWLWVPQTEISVRQKLGKTPLCAEISSRSSSLHWLSSSRHGCEEWGPSGSWVGGLLTFWLLLCENFRPEEVAQSFWGLGYFFSLLQSGALWRETVKVCVSFRPQGNVHMSLRALMVLFKKIYKKLHKSWLKYLEASPQCKSCWLWTWECFSYCLLQHHHRIFFFSRGDLWYAVTKQDFQVQISWETAGLRRADIVSYPGTFPTTENGKDELNEAVFPLLPPFFLCVCLFPGAL